ncbi:putative ATP-dependent RNA helicase DHR1 [Blastocladiella emersonii ATCC 22665]|nr:putative ATP-dependent RNA helicase DHR1 [Blastocladiella emersonii ATCC 22665]
MGKNRVRFNERGRTKPKVDPAAAVPDFDPNAEIIDASKLAAVKAAAKAQVWLYNAGLDEPEGEVMSKRKKKRFEQFLAKKSKKEEHRELLEKLSTSSFNHSLLKSSARLGQAKETKKEVLTRALTEEKMGLTPSYDLYVKKTNKSQQFVDEDPNAMAVDGPAATMGSTLKRTASAVTVVDFSGPGVNSTTSLADAATSSSAGAAAADAPPSKKRKKNSKKGKAAAGAEEEVSSKARTSRRIDDSDSDSEPILVSTGGSTKPKVYVIPDREPAVVESRMKLPVVQEEDRVMETINAHAVTVLCGETGSGKTTQVPQFLYEAGFSHPASDFPGLIGVTQPRRVAAVSMAQRIGHELNKADHVSYQIRFERTTNRDTRIHFMTDGVLLKEVSADLLLSRYSVMIVDEAHERNINTDILIGVLSRVVNLRQKLHLEWTQKKATADRLGQTFTERRVTPLKLIIMSATLRVSDFTMNTRLFPAPPPVINVQARQFPVTVHFNRRTPQNHVVEAYRKVCKIHARLPPGGILVFMTGQNEIYDVVNRLRKKYPSPLDAAAAPAPAAVATSGKKGKSRAAPAPAAAAARKSARPEIDTEATVEERLAEVDTGMVNGATVSTAARAAERSEKVGTTVTLQPAEGTLPAAAPTAAAGAGAAAATEDDEEEFLLSDDEDDGQDADLDEDYDPTSRDDFDEAEDDDDEAAKQPLHVLPLYSLLSTDQQMRVFDAVPEGHRLCVVATNVAETSLTIPGIRYVVDCGKVKEKVYDADTSIQNFVVNWTSKASADQRAGRAGRTGPGHCYRLFSSAVYEHQFVQFSEPEVLRMPIEGVVLQLKAMNIDNVINFPFPTPPNRGDLAKAEKLLASLGAVDDRGKITPVGVKMSQLPIHPRYAKMLLLGMQQGLIEYAIAMVAALSVGEVFVSQNEMSRATGKKGGDSESEEEDEEHAADVKATPFDKVMAKFAGVKRTSDALYLLNLVGAFEYAGGTPRFCQAHLLRLKAMVEIRALRKQLTAMVQTINPGLQVTMNPRMSPPSEDQMTLLRQLILAGFVDHLAIPHPNPPTVYGNGSKRFYYQTMLNDQPACIERTSVLHAHRPTALVFSQLQQGSANVWMRCATEVDLAWVGSIGKPLCHFGKPLEVPPPTYVAKTDTILAHVVPTIGPHAWELPTTMLPLTKAPAVHSWFGRFLLEGAVLATFKPLAAVLATSPSAMSKDTYRGQRKVVELTQQLVGKNVTTKAQLLAAWKANPKFLLEAVLLWVKPEAVDALRKQWPPIKAPLKF